MEKGEIETNLFTEIKEILLQVDHEFFSACRYEPDAGYFREYGSYWPSYHAIVSMPLMYPNMDFVHPVHKKNLHFKIRCRVDEHSFGITDDGYIGMKFQSLGYYGFSTYAFEVDYPKKGLQKRLQAWYDFFNAVVPLIGVT